MEVLQNFVNWLNDLIWSQPTNFPFMVVVLLSFGIFITLRLGFIQLRKFKHGVLSVMGKFDDPDAIGDVNHFQALTTALSATVGIGNIAGVAIAIHYGGPGALFWMWVTAFFGMAIKYSECTLAVKYRIQNADGSVSGGPMYYIERGLGPKWKWLAVFFATMAVLSSFLTGNAVQANTVSDTLFSTLSIPVWVTGIVTASLVAVVIIGGIKRIGNVTARLMPLMALVYVLGALIILLINYQDVVPSFKLIVTSAFNPKAGIYGVVTGSFLTTLVWGIKRGLFSNEAGQGSAPIAHGAARTKEPVREGVVALLEPFIDTLVVCTMTGLVIVSTGAHENRNNAPFNPNSNEVDYVMENNKNAIIIENGEVVNGQVIVNDAMIGSIFERKSSVDTPITATITLNDEGKYVIRKENGDIPKQLRAEIVENGAPLTSFAFERGLAPIIPGGKYIVTLSVFLFAVSTAISWSYYGDRSIQYLAGDKSIIYYKFVYVIMHFIGAVLTLETVWTIGDIALGLMTFPNIIALFALSGVVATSSKAYFKKMETKS